MNYIKGLIIFSVFAALIDFNYNSTESSGHMRYIPYSQQIDEDCDTTQQRRTIPKPTTTKRTTESESSQTKARQLLVSARPISRPALKTKKQKVESENFKKYGYLIDFANSDFSQLSEANKYRGGLYIMAAMAKKKYPLLAIDTLDLAVAFSKVGFLECKNRNGNSAVNRHSNAKGIWQFMPKYRKKYGVPEDVHMLPLFEQLPYAWDYFCHKIDNQYTNKNGDRIDQTKIKNWIDVYMLIFAPALSDDGLDVQFYKSCNNKAKCATKRKCAYHGNKGYDYDKNGAISKRDIRDRANKKHFK